VVAGVLVALVLAQACSDSSNPTGPTKSTSVALKVHRAQIPGGCTGSLVVDGPNNFHLEVPIPPSGEVSFQAPIGVPLTLTVILDCGAQGTFTGSTSFTAAPGNNQAAVTVVATSAGVSCSPGTVEPGQPSSCVCAIKSPGPPTVTWAGSVSPTTGVSTTFRNSTPGTYTVTCTVNNAASASTSVTVRAEQGDLRVRNSAGSGCTFCTVDVTFSPSGIAPISNLNGGQTVQRNNVPPGDYVASGCFGTVPFQIRAGQTTSINVDGANCG
jgi:hypothetical protein